MGRANKMLQYSHAGVNARMGKAPKKKGAKVSKKKAVSGSSKKKSFPIAKSGNFHGKSNALGHGGRAAQLKARGVPGGVIGALARRAGAAPGGPNYHGGKRKSAHSYPSRRNG